MSPKQSNASGSSGTTKNVLPPKEQNLFKSVVRFYETKQLKKALKTADAVLRKYPNHGETLAMKGLTVNALDRKSEALDLVRRGIRMDMKSHICWHVYGLLYRSERDYREAAKAYLNALRIDKDNQQILRDLSLLQVQIRDFYGLEDTRRRLLTVRPNQRINWIGFALSYHLLGNYATAISVMDTFFNTLIPSNEQEDPYEMSELLMYKNMILEESTQYAAALTHINSVSGKLRDRFSVYETKARLHAAIGEHDVAAKILRRLIAFNPDNYFYHHALHTCTLRAAAAVSTGGGDNKRKDLAGLTATNDQAAVTLRYAAMSLSTKPSCRPDGSPSWQASSLARTHPLPSESAVQILLSLCDDISSAYPFSRTSSRIALDIIPDASHPQFLSRIDAYIRPFLRKGIPSLFSNVKPLYDDQQKALVLGSLFESYRNSLEAGTGSLPAPKKSSTTSAAQGDDDDVMTTTTASTASASLSGVVEAPCTLLWVLHYLAQHYDRMGERIKALELIDRAIAHTPTAIECYLVKARILKHAGDLQGAVGAADEARNLDLADRYLNTKCCKFALRADMVLEAEGWVSLFTRDGDSGGVQALYDMQCMWFEVLAAESHLRRSQLPQALKKFTAVERHCADMIEDQFDFHSYCLRKVTLRAYVSLLRFEDGIRRQRLFARATVGLMRCLLQLLGLAEKERLALAGEHADIEGYGDMSDAQRKKAVSKRKKQAARQRPGQGGGNGKGGTKPSVNGTGKGKGNSGEGGKGVSTKAGGEGGGKQKANSGWMEADPTGTELVKGFLRREDGKKGDALMQETTRVMREMENILGDMMETHEFGLELALNRRKYLQGLRAVRRGMELDASDVRVLMMSVRLSYEVGKEAVQGLFSEVVAKVFEVEGDVLGGRTIAQFVEEFERRHRGVAKKRVGVGRVKLWAVREGVDGCGTEADICEWVTKAIEESSAEGVGDNVLTPVFCKEFVERLRDDGVAEETVGKIVESLRRKHTMATCW